MYWTHHDEILTTPSSELPDLVRSLVAASSYTDDALNLNQGHPGIQIKHISGHIFIYDIASLQRHNLLQSNPDAAFLCLMPDDPTHFTRVVGAGTSPETCRDRILCIQTPEGKKGQYHFLTIVLPHSIPFIQHHLQRQRTICIACTTGTDLSVGVAVAALALYFRPDGSLCGHGNARQDMCT